eukprot:TRINITY_DN4805_c0_g1_i1.p1 TRINITY_DN4805_c0_g1~~TRINITY_DN4805_c0_g1_i1.p1  ORF type:complete len:363 (-),score=62.77 TRINITY_DN4805_c0_g1_i1:28-1116(-)
MFSLNCIIVLLVIYFVVNVEMTTKRAKIYRNGGNPSRIFETDININSNPDTMNELIESSMNALWFNELEELLKYYHYFDIRDKFGRKLENTINIQDGDSLYLVPRNEHWMYPPHTLGHKLEYLDTFKNKTIVIETIHENPPIFRVDDFLNDEEIEQIVEASFGKLEDSFVGPHSERQIITDRTSKTAWLMRKDYTFIEYLDKRIFQAMGMPFYSEIDDAIQVVSYRETQKYTCHVDYFWNNTYTTNEDIAYKKGVNRMITFFYYLHEPEAGGETAFCNIQVDSNAEGYCGKYFKVKPKKGSAIFWYSLQPEFSSITEKMMPNPNSLHAGCPVEKGFKIGSNKWFFNKHPPGHTLGDQSRFID